MYTCSNALISLCVVQNVYNVYMYNYINVYTYVHVITPYSCIVQCLLPAHALHGPTQNDITTHNKQPNILADTGHSSLTTKWMQRCGEARHDPCHRPTSTYTCTCSER